MTYKTLEDRRKHYAENKDEINRKRREHNKIPKFKEKRRLENKRWRKANPELANERSRISRKKFEEMTKRLVFEHYGKECVCCGEDEVMFLTMDHIDGGGEKHRKEIGRKIYNWLYRNNFPEGFQVLCMNCNWGKYLNGGSCPHKQKK